ncbi:hypothetical protein CDAR_388791 [Caerostris darwini]|uniref:Uncharacterized protein n=1 Tax=Caerostris darwini TaxID=1538125 RepID=A0AAV4S8B8_9ARAC|nr:hypothetical protein CDAR_388791 [Caerostris darwini]
MILLYIRIFFKHRNPIQTSRSYSDKHERKQQQFVGGRFPRDTHRGGARHASVGGRATPRSAAGDEVCVPPAVATGFRRRKSRAPRSASPVATAFSKNSPAEFIHTVGWTVIFFYLMVRLVWSVWF